MYWDYNRAIVWNLMSDLWEMWEIPLEKHWNQMWSTPSNQHSSGYFEHSFHQLAYFSISNLKFVNFVEVNRDTAGLLLWIKQRIKVAMRRFCEILCCSLHLIHINFEITEINRKWRYLELIWFHFCVIQNRKRQLMRKLPLTTICTWTLNGGQWLSNCSLHWFARENSSVNTKLVRKISFTMCVLTGDFDVKK